MTKQLPSKVAYGVDLVQPTNLTLKGEHSTLDFNQNVEDLAKKSEQVLM